MVKCGGYRYEDGTRYIGDWNHKGQKHGMGHLILPGKNFLNKVFFTVFFLTHMNVNQMERDMMVPL